MKRTLGAGFLREVHARLEHAHDSQYRRFDGASSGILLRRPVHVVYGGAHLFRAGTARRLGDIALRSLEEFAPDFAAFAKALKLAGADRLPGAADAVRSLASSIAADGETAKEDDFAGWLADHVYQRVREKLQREPVEDYRIDFEDGYGNRPDAEEDAHAESAARELAAGWLANELPPFFGLRIKPIGGALRERALRTLDIFLTEFAAKAGALPKELRVTLPKVALPEDVAALADVCSQLEPALGFEPGALRIEIMVESPRAIFNERGEAALPGLVAAARGRCIGAHFGPYDYMASLEMAVARNALSHFAADFAREMMHVALAGTPVAIADGPTNVLPIAPHRAAPGAELPPRQRDENQAVVHAAWRLHYDNIRRALQAGIYQGWDLHPAQLPVRYAALYAFVLENLDSASRRLRNFVEAAAQATRLGQVFDDAAMVRGLVNYFLLALNCGALTADEVERRTTLSPGQLRSLDFLERKNSGHTL
jgi:citrate lyase beta subunit